MGQQGMTIVSTSFLIQIVVTLAFIWRIEQGQQAIPDTVFTHRLESLSSFLVLL
jgi:hypothetical protein